MEHNNSSVLTDYWLNMCSGNHFLSVSRKHLSHLRLRHSWAYSEISATLECKTCITYCKSERKKKTASVLIYFLQLIFHLQMTFPHLLCLDPVLHNMALISVSNYSSSLSSLCGLRSVKRQLVSSCSSGKGLGDTCLR